MFESLFRNMTPVVKNLLIINVIVFIAVHLLAFKGIDVGKYLFLYHYTSAEFQPYQYVTTMFFHLDGFHLFANMLGLVSFGTNLERFIGPKRFLILYVVSGLLGGLFYTGFHAGELLMMGEDLLIGAQDINYLSDSVEFNFTKEIANAANNEAVGSIIFSRALGASGAVFGIFAAVYRYFPNTEVMLLFPPIPLKIKWLFLVLMGGSLLLSLFPFMMQGVAHMAHFGGGVGGLLLVQFWQKDKTTFY
jgi:membrane associated rhomboid family serine protease